MHKFDHPKTSDPLSAKMSVVAPTKEAEALRPSSFAQATEAVVSTTLKPTLKADLPARDYPKAFDQVARQITQALVACNVPAPEKEAQSVLEQLLLLRLLDEKGWLASGHPVWHEQFQKHWEADPESTSFYAGFVVPRVRVLATAGLLSQTTTLTPLPLTNAVCKIVFDVLFTPFRYRLAEIEHETPPEEQLPNEPLVDAAMSGMLFLRTPTNAAVRLTAPPQTARRVASTFVAPRRVARWLCRATLVQYLSAKLGEASQLAEREVRQRLNAFFALPPAALLTEEQSAALDHLFLRAEAQLMSRALLNCRACDPATGGGDLLAAMLEELADALAKLDVQLYGRAIVQQHNYEFRLKSQLVNECLFGVDRCATAIRLTRQRLWLALVAAEQSRPDAALAITMREAANTPGLSQHLICGDSLLGCRAFDDSETSAEPNGFKWRKTFPEIFNLRGGFDLILGNAPYRIPPEEKEHWGQLCALFPQLKRAKNLAAAFFDLPRLIGAPHAIACQVIPRALTLAEGWGTTRASLRLNYELLVAASASEILKDARFEQEILLYRREPASNDGFSETVTLPTPRRTSMLGESVQTAPNEISKGATQAAISPPALVTAPLTAVGNELLERLMNLRTLAEVATLKSGQRWQRRNRKSDEKASVTVPVVKGTNLRQFRITDELPRLEPPAYIQRVLEELRQPKLLVAQTLPHLKKPYDTLLVMSALDRQGAVALDTVNQIFPHADCPFSLELLCALLNSSFARWYFHFVVFQRAQHSAECSPQDLSRLPLPARPATALITQAERLTRKLCKVELPRKYLLRGQGVEYDTLDEVICELYGLSEDERAEIWRQA